jgi:hypothetical protein
MFSKRNDLSPDLKWMLQSHQVDDDTLVEALANKYYPRIFRAALTRLTYPEQAQRAAKETFVQAIIKSKTYRGAVNVSDWLDGIAAKICDDLSASQGTQQLLNPKLIQSIKNSRKEDELSPQQLELAIQEIKAEVHSRKTSGSKKITAQVLGLLGVITLVLLIMIGTRNYWTPDPFSEIPPSSLESGDEQSASEIVTRQQDIDQSDQAPSIEPLTLNSTSDEIRERIKSSSQYWDTLWAELIVTFHGPGSYVGPPIRERHQYWIDPQRGGMLVSGPLDGFPNFIERFSIPAGFEIEDRSMGVHNEYAQIGSQIPWFALNSETFLNLPFVLNYLADSTMSDGLQNVSYIPVGEQIWAGHQVLIVDLVFDSDFVMARVHLEPDTGIVLREQYYAPESNRKTVIESNLIDLKFNQPMPTMWKRPDSALDSPRKFLPGSNIEVYDTFSESYSTLLTQISASNAPSNFDPARSRLFFHSSNPLEVNEDGFVTYSIFADDFYIGDIDLINPLQMICTRSSNGKRIAFANWTVFLAEETEMVYWFDLDELQLSRHQLPEMALVWIEFSPDNSILGMSGYSEVDGGNRFILLDTNNGTSRTLPISAGFNRISWSPDGSQILVLEETGSSFDLESRRTLNFYSANDGQLVERIEVENVTTDLNQLKIQLDGWEVEFDLTIQDITTCAAP